MKKAFLSASLIILLACNSGSKKDDLIKSLSYGLEQSNHYLFQSTGLLLAELQDKKLEIAMSDRASYWLPKAEEASIITKEIFNYLEDLKKENRITFVKSDTLCRRLYKFENSLWSLDSLITSNFAKSDYHYSEKESKSFYNKHFKNSRTLDLMASILRIENEILLLAYKVIAFCNNQVGMVDGPGFYTAYSAILGQNSTILKPGETLEIKAGLGEFTGTPKTRILIGGIAVPLNESGYAIYKVQVSKLGKHSIPVTIIFFNPITSKEEEFSHSVQYTVAKSCDQ